MASAPAAATPSDATRRGWTILAALLLGTSVLSAAAFATRIAIVLQYPYQLNYTEGSTANWAAWAQTDLGLYPPIDTGPFIHHPYMPLFHWLVATLGRAGFTGLPILRLLAVVPAVLVGLVLAIAVRRRCGGWTLPVLAAGLWYSWPAVYVFGVMARPELLAMLFICLGMTRLRASTYGAIEAVGWFGAAILCKQPYIFAAAAAGLWLLIHDRKSAMLYAAGMAILGVAIVGGGALATGEWFWWHTVVATNNEWTWAPVGRWYGYHATHVAVPFALAAIAGVGEMRERMFSPWTIYFGVAWAATLLVGKWGADLHYFIEPAAPTIVLATAGAHALMRRGTPAAAALAGVLGVATILPLLHWPGVRPIYQYDYTPTREAREESDAVVQWIRARPGEVLCLNQELVVLAGKRCWIQPWMFAVLAQEGIWDESVMVQQVRDGKFGTILLPHDVAQYAQIGPARTFYSAGFNAAVQDAYTLIGILPYADGRPRFYAYVPRGR